MSGGRLRQRLGLGRPGALRRVLLASTVGVVAAAAFAVPLPWVEYVPGDVVPIAPLVTIADADVTDLDGSTGMLTVRVRQQPLTSTIAALVDPSRTLVPAVRVYPDGVDRQSYLAEQRRRFERQFDVAAAVGARAAGYPIELVTEVVVLEVLPGGPADGVLAAGDTVLAVEGVALASSEELQASVRERRPGDTITLTIRHAGAVRDVTVTLADLDESGRARIGVLVSTAVDDILLPLTVTLAPDVRIGGPSAGLMVGLTVYDLLADEDLLRGRTVVGTGSLDVDGRVGEVGGVAAKLRAALEAGADVAFVPRSQLAEAQDAIRAGLTVIGVDTIDEAIAALRGEGTTAG
jgi:Lon-like protease